MAAKKQVEIKKQKKPDNVSDNALQDMNDLLNGIEKAESIFAGSGSNKPKISTGLLVIDLILGGGLTSGAWHTFFGGEQSSKSTLAMTQLAKAATDNETKILLYFDFEGSFSADYQLAIAKSLGFKGSIHDLFGLVNEDGNYVTQPLIRKYSLTVAEKFFNMVYRLEKTLPDKIFKKDKWWLVYENTKENAKYAKHADPKMLKKTKQFWIETDNEAPQALIVVDSYPAMLPEKMDDEDGKTGIGAQARMFSEQLKRIKGRMEAKGVIIMGVNQLREKPMVMFGCLQADTMIPFSDGRSFPIRQIVEEKIQGEVLAYDEKAQVFKSAKIKNYFYNGEVSKATDWITISTNEIVETKNGRASVTVTPNHKIYTQRGWIPANKIKVGDKVLSKFNSFFEKDLQPVLAGMLSGDSHICVDSNQGHLRLQDSLNTEYVKWKMELLSSVTTFRLCGTKKQTWVSNRFYQFTDLKNVIGERDPIKLKEYMNELSLAIWYMDDGSFQKDRERATLCVARFSADLKKMEAIQKMLFNKFGLESSNIGKSLLFNTENTMLLHSIIARHVPEPMQYKLSSEYQGKYKKPLIESAMVQRKIWCTVTEITTGSPRKFRQKGKYDIEVEGYHNYLAGNKHNGFLVHNSPEYEPGGSALKFFSDVRLKMVSRAAPLGEPRKKDSSNFVEEPSIEFDNALDTYRYINVKAVKNKLSAGSDMSGWIRLWVRDGEGVARGYDPVWDTAEFLRSIGVLTGSRNKLVLDWKKLKIKGLEQKQKLDWNGLKTIVIGNKEQFAKAMKQFGYTGKYFNLRKKLFDFVKSKQAHEMYFATLAAKSKTNGDDSDE